MTEWSSDDEAMPLEKSLFLIFQTYVVELLVLGTHRGVLERTGPRGVFHESVKKSFVCAGLRV